MWPGGPEISKKKIPKDISPSLRLNIQELYSYSVKERVEAARKLRRIGAKADAAIPFLVSMLGDNALYIYDDLAGTTPSAEAGYALVDIGQKSKNPLINALSNKNKQIRRGAASALGFFKDDPLVAEYLSKAIHDDYWKVRRETAEALGRIHTCKTIKPLLLLLEDKKAEVREESVYSLGRTGALQVVEPLIRMLSDKSHIVRSAALNRLAGLGAYQALPEIKRVAIDDNVNSVRSNARLALKNIHNPVYKIVDCFKDEQIDD